MHASQHKQPRERIPRQPHRVQKPINPLIIRGAPPPEPVVDLPEHVLSRDPPVDIQQHLVIGPAAAVVRKVVDVGPHDVGVAPAVHGDLYQLAGGEDTGRGVRGDEPGVAADAEEAQGLADGAPVLGGLDVRREDVASGLGLFCDPAEGVDAGGGLVLDLGASPVDVELPNEIPHFEGEVREVPEARYVWISAESLGAIRP